jgi:malate dehydrogenase (oxaloacetate-decarboxylating)
VETSRERETQSSIFRTLRIRTANRVGVLAHVLAVIADHNASVGDLRTVFIGPLSRVRDIDLGFIDEAEITATVAAITAIGDAEVLEVRDEVLEFHVGGKLVVQSRYPVHTQADLRRVYTPGVGEVARRIAADPSLADHYTIRANTVAIVSDGTAVLGLGNLGPLAALPILEGKAALLSQLVGVYGIPLVSRSSDPDRMVDGIDLLSAGFGVVQLEDIAAPACFGIEERLIERRVPVFHDDQHGTASVVLAAIISAAKIVDRKLTSSKIGCIGLGAAGSAIATALMRYFGNPVLGCDINTGAVTRIEAAGGKGAELREVMASCDIVVATTGKAGLIDPAWVRNGQMIFALSNPNPEIESADALAAGAALATDGRATNNLLAFPGLCRGGLDCGIKTYHPEVFAAVSEAIVSLADSGQLLPAPLDPAVHKVVSRAAALAAIRAGVASREVPSDYMLTGR